MLKLKLIMITILIIGSNASNIGLEHLPYAAIELFESLAPARIRLSSGGKLHLP